MTLRQWQAAQAVFVAAGWVPERSSRGKRYALPWTSWKGRVGDLYTMVYRLEGRGVVERYYFDTCNLGILTVMLEELQVEQEDAMAAWHDVHGVAPWEGKCDRGRKHREAN